MQQRNTETINSNTQYSLHLYPIKTPNQILQSIQWHGGKLQLYTGSWGHYLQVYLHL